MKKLTIAFMIFASSMHAYGVTLPPASKEEVKEIVVPSIATGFYRTQNFTYDKDINILICPKNMKYESNLSGNITCKDDKGKNAWEKMENAVPKGKKFVGFKSVTEGYKHMIEIYWK